MSVSTMAVSVIVEQEKSENIRRQTKAPDYKHQFRVGYFLGLDEPLDRFEKNR
jgi:hypothetical protein